MTSLAGSRAFVTGATAFIGSHLVRRLLQGGAEVSILVRQGSDLGPLADILSDVHVFECDICDNESLRQVLTSARPQRVFHLAAYTQVARGYSHAKEAMAVNLHGTINLLRAVEDIDLARFIATGTCEEYGNAEPPLHEEMPLRPVSPYSVSKAAATLWCQMVHQTSNLPVVILRPFLCYGPGQGTNRLVPSAIIAALKGDDFPMTRGEQTRELTHISDIIEGYMKAAVVPEAIGQVINLGNGVEYRTRDIVEKIYAMIGGGGRPLVGAVPYRPAEIWRISASTQKSRDILGWECKIDLEQGLRETVASYRESVDAGSAAERSVGQ